MKCGPLCSKKPINVGFGRSCADGHARLSPLCWEIGVTRPADASGNKSRPPTNNARPIVTSGVHTARCYPKKRIRVLARRVAKRITWSDGTIRYASAMRAMCERPCPFPSRTSITNSSHESSSSNTTWAYHSSLSHHPFLYTNVQSSSSWHSVRCKLRKK